MSVSMGRARDWQERSRSHLLSEGWKTDLVRPTLPPQWPNGRLISAQGRLERLLSQTKNRQASEEEKRCPASEPSGTGKDAVVEWDAELSLFIANAVREL